MWVLIPYTADPEMACGKLRRTGEEMMNTLYNSREQSRIHKKSGLHFSVKNHVRGGGFFGYSGETSDGECSEMTHILHAIMLNPY